MYCWLSSSNVLQTLTTGINWWIGKSTGKYCWLYWWIGQVKASVVEFIDEKEGKVQESTVECTAETSSSS